MHLMDLQLRVQRHKKEEIQLGDHSAILAHCKSDRPAFVIDMLDPANEKSVKLINFYAAMGLPKQHDLQQSLLAGCYKDYRVSCVCYTLTAATGQVARTSWME